MGCTKEEISDIVRVALEAYEKKKVLFTAPAGVTGRYVILNRKDQARLFGEGHAISAGLPLRQPREYLCKETLTVVGNKNVFFHTHIMGGESEKTQVVLTRSDMMNLGLDLDAYDKAGRFSDAEVALIGPAGMITAGSCVRSAERSVVLSEFFAEKYGLAEGDFVSVRTGGQRPTVFHKVRIKVGYYTTEFRLDTDEANGAGIQDGDAVEVGFF